MEAVLAPIERLRVQRSDLESPHPPKIRPAALAGFFTALAVHALVLFWQAPFLEPAAFGVRSGEASAEASFAGLEAVQFEFLPPVSEDVKTPDEKPIAAPESPAMVLQSEPTPAESVPGTASASVLSGEGAPWTDPDYAVNRPPVYPPDALRRNIEGTVMLMVRINESGAAETVEIETSSGHAVLDRAARSTVAGWAFRPARIGGIAVPSKSRVPVEFKILRDQ